MRKIGDNKKGEQMTISTIIVIALGILVLVLLIFGFTTGWKNLWNKITIWGGGGSNVETIVQVCAVSCGAQSQYEYCEQVKTVKFGEEKNIIVVGDLGPTYNRGKSLDASCNDLTTKYRGMNLGIASCPDLCD